MFIKCYSCKYFEEHNYYDEYVDDYVDYNSCDMGHDEIADSDERIYGCDDYAHRE